MRGGFITGLAIGFLAGLLVVTDFSARADQSRAERGFMTLGDNLYVIRPATPQEHPAHE